MRQVPNKYKTYLIIGNGRVAKHFECYFNHLKIPFLQWTRKSSSELSSLVNQSNKILLCINDSEIENFVKQRLLTLIKNQIIVHFSGLLSTDLAESAHPLMTFSNTLYDLETYKSIHFVTENDRKSFTELFPELSNNSSSLNQNDKKKYHLWCSMAGNFSSILWKEFFENLDKIGIKKEQTIPYLQQIFNNLVTEENPITGPLVRNDTSTLTKHYKQIKNTPYEKIYTGFAELFNINLVENNNDKH